MVVRNGRVSCSYSFFALVAVALMRSHAAFAADQHRLELKDIPKLVGTTELTQASDVAISPDGNWVAYTVKSKSLTAGRQRSDCSCNLLRGDCYRSESYPTARSLN